MSTFMEHIHRDTDTLPLLPGALTCRSADLTHDHFATETCPACGYDGVDTFTTETPARLARVPQVPHPLGATTAGAATTRHPPDTDAPSAASGHDPGRPKSTAGRPRK